MRKNLTTEQFVEKAKLVHGDKYDYSKFIYVNARVKGTIICKKHGDFLQTPSNHLSGYGCSKCAGNMKLTTKQFIEKANLIHNNKYDYSLFVYTGDFIKGIIICPVHGEFLQIPHHHLRERGCPKCAGRHKTTEECITEFNTIHNNFYGYTKFVYVDSKTKGIITCLKHGEFKQTPNEHLSGCGCPTCGNFISKQEIEFLDYFNIKTKHYSLPEWRRKNVDGIDLENKVVYEFLGDFWHGNPEKFNPNDINKATKKTFAELYNKTFNVFAKITKLGYVVKYIWENDWKRFKDGKVNEPRVLTFFNGGV